MTDAADDAAGSEARERGELHRGERRVPRTSGEDADPDGEPLGAGERGGGERDAGGEEAVLDHPQLIGAACLQSFGELDSDRRRELAREAAAELR